MSFRALDDEAVEFSGEHMPVASAVAQQLRDNVEAIGADRFYRTGVGFHVDYPMRICSPGYPMPMLPLWIWVDEAHTEIRLRVRAASVERTGDSGDSDALRLFLGVIGPDGRYTHPPGTGAAWGDSDAGSSVTLTGSAQTITLTAPTDRVGAGWVGAVLWVWSHPRDTSIETGTVNDFYFPLAAVLDSSAVADGVIERALWLTNDYAINKGWAGSGTQEGALFGVGYWNLVGDNTVEAFLVPPPRRGGAASSVEAWGLYALSVIEVDGLFVECEPTPADTLPGADAFATYRPVTSTVYGPLVNTLQGFARRRVRTLAPAIAQRISAGNQPLGITAGTDLDVAQLEASAWVTIQSVLVPTEPVNDGGYQCIVSGLLAEYQRDPADAQLEIRLAALTINSTVQDSNQITVDVVPAAYTLGAQADDDWDGRVLNMLMQRAHGSWQYHGSLLGRPNDWASSLRGLFHFTVTLDPDSISYPCEIAVQLQLTGTRQLAFYGTAAIAERVRDIHGGA